MPSESESIGPLVVGQISTNLSGELYEKKSWERERGEKATIKKIPLYSRLTIMKFKG